MPLYRAEIFPQLAWWVVLLLVGSLVGCAPEIGDSCTSALDCSASGTRLCDRTQLGGYCTLEGCEEKTCPEEAVCVQFGRRIDGVAVDRLTRSYCMYKCEANGDCRSDEGYACFKADEFGGTDEARTLGNSKQGFCAARPPAPVAKPDAGEPEDAAMSMPEEDASMMSAPDAGDDAGLDAAMSTPDDGGSE